MASPLVPPPSLLIRVRALAASSRALDTDDVRRRRISGSDNVWGSSLDSSPVPKGGAGGGVMEHTMLYYHTATDGITHSGASHSPAQGLRGSLLSLDVRHELCCYTGTTSVSSSATCTHHEYTSHTHTHVNPHTF